MTISAFLLALLNLFQIGVNPFALNEFSETREAVLLLYENAETNCEKSHALELMAEYALRDGFEDESTELFTRAILLLEPEDPTRRKLIEKAVESLPVSVHSGAMARLLLRETESRSLFRVLELGGVDICQELITESAFEESVIREYLALAVSDTLIANGMYKEALEILELVPENLPEPAISERTRFLHNALLCSGMADSAYSILQTVETNEDSQLLSLMYHDRGIFFFRNAQSLWCEDLIRSFNLWPAAHVHAKAYEILRPMLLMDSTLANQVADPFYSGGLWNEIYDLAANSTYPSAHILYLGARTRDRLGFYQEAVNLLGSYIECFPNGEDAPLARAYLGLNLGRLGLVEEALAHLDTFVMDYPLNSRIGNIPWYRGSILADNGRWEESIPHFRETVRRYPDNVTVDDAQFYVCLAYIIIGNWTESIAELRSFTAKWTRSVYYDSAQYWLGRLLLEQNSPEGTIILETLIANSPECFPAFCARQYLGMEPWTPEFTDEAFDEWIVRTGNPPSDIPGEALRGLALLDVGLRKWALGEFRAAEEIVGSSSGLAYFYLENQVWERMPSAGWRLWNVDSQGTRPRDLWRLRYPEAWPEYVIPTCDQYNFNPLLLWAIMKQESAFQPDCFSWAGARGLIQMIPSTSEYVAEANGWCDEYSPDILYDPEVSVRYGTSYISDVLNKSGSVPVMLASYNGGPHNGLRWGGTTVAPDMFFSRITYNETKRYTEIVYHNLAVYMALYGDKYFPSENH